MPKYSLADKASSVDDAFALTAVVNESPRAPMTAMSHGCGWRPARPTTAVHCVLALTSELATGARLAAVVAVVVAVDVSVAVPVVVVMVVAATTLLLGYHRCPRRRLLCRACTGECARGSVVRHPFSLIREKIMIARSGIGRAASQWAGGRAASQGAGVHIRWAASDAGVRIAPGPSHGVRQAWMHEEEEGEEHGRAMNDGGLARAAAPSTGTSAALDIDCVAVGGHPGTSVLVHWQKAAGSPKLWPKGHGNARGERRLQSRSCFKMIVS